MAVAKKHLAGIFELLAESPGAELSSKLRMFGFLVLLHMAVQFWEYVFVPFTNSELRFPPVSLLMVTLMLSFCTGLTLTCHLRKAFCLALVPAFYLLYWRFPWLPNHPSLAMICLCFLVLLDSRDKEESILLLQSLRWIAIVVLFYSGWQKLVSGFWFQGEFLSYYVAHAAPRWQNLFELVLSREEIARLASLELRPESASYRSSNVPLVLISNVTYVFELVMPVFLVIRRTRGVAVVSCLVFMLLLQAAAAEIMFFLLFSKMLLLFSSRNWLLRLAPVYVVIYVYLLGAVCGLLPAAGLIKASGRI